MYVWSIDGPRVVFVLTGCFSLDAICVVRHQMQFGFKCGTDHILMLGHDT
jgi:hypothetical protein